MLNGARKKTRIFHDDYYKAFKQSNINFNVYRYKFNLLITPRMKKCPTKNTIEKKMKCK